MLVIVGPSACGKSMIVNELIKNYHFKKLITYTTRKMRINEQQDVDYHFISFNEFKEKINNNFFLEYVCYNQNYYGTSYSELSNDKVVIIEAEGLKKYVEKARDKITIVYIRCSKPIRRIRMIERKDSLESIDKRLNGDDEVFNDNVKKLADLVIDSSGSNIYDDAKTIFNFYISKGKNNED